MLKNITMFLAGKKWAYWSLILLLAFFSYLMLEITLQYVPMRFDVAFLKIKQSQVQLPFYRVAFYVHVYTSMLALLAGFTQFNKKFRSNSSVHRNVGKLYVAVILGLSGPSGFIMALFANGGFSSQIGFSLLAIFWMTSTLQAFRSAKNKDFIQHRNWMILSYALTLSAVTLRLWKMGIVWAFQPPPMDAYRIVAWLGWVPNLLVAFLLWKKKPF
ncbi:MAG: DUF2306 domain-containing protein [Flavobacteriales bacterium]